MRREQGEQRGSEGYVILGFRVPTTILSVRGLINSVEARRKGSKGSKEGARGARRGQGEQGGSKEGARGVRGMLY